MDRINATLNKDGILLHTNPASLTLRKGMFIVFDKNLKTFRIENFKDYKIEKPFKVIEDKNKVHIFEDTSDFIFGDYIEMYYSEYEFFGHTKILHKEGPIYINQTFSPVKTEPSLGRRTILSVSDIDGDDIELSVLEKGLYVRPPDPEEIFQSDGGSSKIHIDHFYRKSSIRNHQTNLVKDVMYGQNFTILTLQNDVPNNVTEGYIVANKLFVQSPVDQESLNDMKGPQLFFVISNKLPYLNLPYPEIEDEGASKMLEDIFMKIDYKFSLLEKEIENLKNKN